MPRTVQVLDAAGAARLVHDGQTLAVGGSGNGHGVAEAVLRALEARFLESGHPRGLTLFQVVGIGDWRTRCGVDRLAYPGLVRCAIGSNIGNSPILAQMAAKGELEAYSLPQGVLSQLCRAMAGRQSGLATPVGLHTFVDPRYGGGRLNERTHRELVELVQLGGEELLFYRTVPPDVTLIRATTADEAGNLSFEEEPSFLDALPLAQATHNHGGTVIAQVRRLAARGTLPPKSVVVPGILVDAVVVEPAQPQTYLVDYSPYYAGQLRAPAASIVPLPLDERKIIARRALREVFPGAVGNLGVGVSQGIAAVAAEEGLLDDVTFTVEQGAVGGIAALGPDAGAAINHDAQLPQASQFDFYDGGGLDIAFLSFAEMDGEGNVNVTRFGGRLNGPGGFINISQGAKRVVFGGTFTAGGLAIAAGEGSMIIKSEGRYGKFVARVQEVTYSGPYARVRGQRVTVVTERAVFGFTPDGLQLLEVAPGIDVERDVLAHMAFRPLGVEHVKTMDAEIFR
ncbi:MAG: 3-oxoacid CoA-transferase [Chloroflexi bacterium]|nr:3-oxoacid CoA-transferase [Chloroflexota bacterium]